jgi:hypothetical protein
MAENQPFIENSIKKDSLNELLAKFCNGESRCIIAVSFYSAQVSANKWSNSSALISLAITLSIRREIALKSTSRRALAGWFRVREGGGETKRRLFHCFCSHAVSVAHMVVNCGPRPCQSQFLSRCVAQICICTLYQYKTGVF